MFTIKLFLSIIPIIIIAFAMYKIDIEKEPKKILNQIFISSMIVGLIGALEKRGSHSLMLEVRSSNATALSVYYKLGFNEVGRRRNYYRNPKEDALILRKEWEYDHTCGGVFM